MGQLESFGTHTHNFLNQDTMYAWAHGCLATHSSAQNYPRNEDTTYVHSGYAL